MADQEDINSKIKELIKNYVDKHWADNETVCYLSSIGIHLSQEAPGSRAFLPKGLREFLRQNSIVNVVQFPGIEQKIGAVPLSIPLPDDIRKLFAPNELTSGSTNRKVYVQEFWDAFIRPIEDSPRYILLDKTGDIIVHDSHLSGDIDDAYEIQPGDLTSAIPGRSVVDKVNDTHSAIDNWLKKHSLDSIHFLRSKIQKQDFTISNRLAQFLSAFQGFSSDDLARIDIPLDILFKLISKMIVEHYIVFIGASGSLSDQLTLIEKRVSKSRIIAPAVRRKYTGITQMAIELASEKL